MVIVKGRNRDLALGVDDVIGMQKVVLKSLDALEIKHYSSRLYGAAAVMGDGTVAMILDLDHLV